MTAKIYKYDSFGRYSIVICQQTYNSLKQKEIVLDSINLKFRESNIDDNKTLNIYCNNTRKSHPYQINLKREENDDIAGEYIIEKEGDVYQLVKC